MDNSNLYFSLEFVEKIVTFAFNSGYYDGYNDKFQEFKEYKNVEEFWKNNKEEFLSKYSFQLSTNR